MPSKIKSTKPKTTKQSTQSKKEAEQQRKNIEEFNKIAGNPQVYVGVTTRSRSKMREQIQPPPPSPEVFPNDSFNKTLKKETRIKKESRNRKQNSKNILINAIQQSESIIPMDCFETHVCQRMEKVKHLTSNNNIDCFFEEEALKMLRAGIIEITLKYLNNVHKTSKANTIDDSMELEAQRMFDRPPVGSICTTTISERRERELSSNYTKTIVKYIDVIVID